MLESACSHRSEVAAFEESHKICSKIADYLNVPIQFEEWSPDIISEHQPRG